MGFFTGLTSNALVSSTVTKQPDHKDTTDTPAAIQDQTIAESPRDVEKLGTPTAGSTVSDSDDDSLNKIDTTAEAGVQAVQAATHVWTKRDLILAFVLYAALFSMI